MDSDGVLVSAIEKERERERMIHNICLLVVVEVLLRYVWTGQQVSFVSHQSKPR
jgi:hypothetical protein